MVLPSVLRDQWVQEFLVGSSCYCVWLVDRFYYITCRVEEFSRYSFDFRLDVGRLQLVRGFFTLGCPCPEFNNRIRRKGVMVGGGSPFGKRKVEGVGNLRSYGKFLVIHDRFYELRLDAYDLM